MPRATRDEFTEAIKRLVSNRVGNVCSNPDCRRPTSGPHSASAKRISIGVAAHISAASAGGPRYDSALPRKLRTGIDNAIWLCQNCGKLIDSDELRFNSSRLRQWKAEAEERARIFLERGSPARDKALSSEAQQRCDRHWLAELITLLQLKQASAVELGPGTPEQERAERLVALGELDRVPSVPYHYCLPRTFHEPWA